MKSTLQSVFVVCLIVQVRSACLFASTLYGSTFGGEGPAIYTLDQDTGIATALGGTSFGVADLASDWRPESFRLWGIRSNSHLVKLDPILGNGTLIGRFSMPSVTGLAFDIATDRLYATAGGSLYVVDPATAISTFVGNTGRRAFDALCFNRDGTLFGVTNPDNLLVTIDKTTGFAQTIGSTGIDQIHGLAVRPEDGTMFGVATLLPIFPSISSNLYRINMDTGAATLVGSNFGPNGPIISISGLAFSPAVPEPETLMFCFSAMLCVVLSKHQR
jgi:hypothetical protein